MLQWGHVFSDVEIVKGYTSQTRALLLQWGHVFSDVEIHRVPVDQEQVTSRFNGATSFQTWKCRDPP